METNRRQRAPWSHQLLIYLFTALFGILVYWLLGFVMRDIGTWPGPTFQQVEKRLIDPALTQQAADVQTQIEETRRAIASREQRQKVLRDSTSNSERTMNQLQELQKLTLQKGLVPSTDATKALAESERLFLANQTRYQEMNDQIADLSQQLGGLEDRQREVQKKIESARPAVEREYRRLEERHQIKLASAKLAVLIPLLGLALWLFVKRRGSLYAPLVYGFGLAVVVKVTMVMHEHFPSRYFKYILIFIAIAMVARILVFLLRIVAFPKREWLLKQHREAYEHFLCPVCSHPIRRGPLKHLFWTRGSIKKLRVPMEGMTATEEIYTCPVCATALFEECPSCKKVRHSLLPACTHCGANKEIKTS